MKWKQRLSRGIVYNLLRVVILLTRPLPHNLNVYLGRCLGGLAFWLIPRERKKTLRNLNLALGGEKNSTELQSIAIASYQHLGQSIFELLDLAHPRRLRLASIITIQGREHLDQALALGRGVIFVSAHLGNWELMSIYVASLGYPVNVVGRKVNNAGVNDLLLWWREENGVHTLLRAGKRGVRKGIWKALRSNQLLGLLIDQDTKVEGVFVDFFGHPAYTPVGPVALALASGAAIIPGFMARQSNGRHTIEILPPFPLKITGEKQKDLGVNTAALTKIIEDYVRRYPDQWVWMHERWKRKPPQGNGVEISAGP